MVDRALIFVHGTGTRSQGFQTTYELIQRKVQVELGGAFELHAPLWGEALGTDFEGLSLPEIPIRSKTQEEQLLRWSYLQADPLFELRLWSAPGIREEGEARFGQQPPGQSLWEHMIEPYGEAPSLSPALRSVLEEYHLLDYFRESWRFVVHSQLPESAFFQAGDETPQVSRVFAEAVVATMLQQASFVSQPATITPSLANRVVEIMLSDWRQATLGVGSLLLSVFGGSITRRFVRPSRSAISRTIAPAIGDVCHYLAHGEKLRNLVWAEIEQLSQQSAHDIYLLGHSLGGVICFELLVEACNLEKPLLSRIKGLITVGSQSPLLYEFDALKTLPRERDHTGDPLPSTFSRWLNIYDENDLLSYRAARLFKHAIDKQVDSMLQPAEAHSAYWAMNDTWAAIRDFVKDDLNG